MRRSSPIRSGTFLPMTAVCVVALFSFVALAIDLGMMTVARTECQNAADAAALAGARLLNNSDGVSDNNKANAEAAAKAVVQGNDLFDASFLASDVQTASARVYNYDTSTQTFSIGTNKGTNQSWSAMEVTIGVTQPTYFAKVLGISELNNGATAVAVHRPRDIAIILDFSGSMGYGSTLNWPYNSGTIHGLLNPDPIHPQFGHYGRYANYQNDNPSTNASDNSDPTTRPNPFQMVSFSGSMVPNNITSETGGGPPLIEDFLTAANDPDSVNGSTAFSNAFKMWDPEGSGSYDAFTAATPAPVNFGGQSDSPTTYVGDKWPRNDGGRGPRTTGLGVGTPVAETGNYGSTVKDHSNNWNSFKVNGVTWQYRRERQDHDYTVTTPDVAGWTTTDTMETDRQREYTMRFRKGTSGGDDEPTAAVIAQAQQNGYYKEDTTLSSSTSTAVTDAAAMTVQEFLGSEQTTDSGRTMSSWTFPTDAGYTHPDTDTIDGGNDLSGSETNYRDAVWEAYGYDLDVEDYRNDGDTKSVKLLPQAQRYKGYSMGPGYWGKTFFIWPPDPRFDDGADPTSVQTEGDFAGVKDTADKWICDWRRRFFLRGDGQAFDPQEDDINQILFEDGDGGHIFNDVRSSIQSGYSSSNQPGYYRINYAAVIAWLKDCGPDVLPTNLRSGRILYYSTMPDDLTVSASGDGNDKLFLRHYVHYILGIDEFDADAAPITSWSYSPESMLAGVENNPWYDVSIGTTDNFNPIDGDPEPKPKPYMSYTDTPNFPRAHLWFGPYSMVTFMERAGENRPFWSGTVREAQCWQLKASINSVLDDIRINHPNDHVGICAFATRSHFDTPLAPMSQDWYTLKNVLFFRKDTVADMRANLNAASGVSSSSREHRPYNSNFSNVTTEIPNGAGSTDPVSGFAVAYNLLSSSTQLSSSSYGERGRRGASKIVIFETDGQPNTNWGWNTTGTQADTRFYRGGSSSTSTGGVTVSSLSYNNSYQNAAHAAIRVAQQITKSQTGNGTWGHSTPNTPARIYSIMFGDLFEGYDGSNFDAMSSAAKGALEFGLRIQQVGNTSSAGNPPTMKLPDEHVITGDYTTRIANLRTALERIMQSGVQVTLIE